MTKFAAAYLRRSFASAGNPGDASREAQEAAVRSMCGADVTLYADWGISGRRSDRPDYQRLRADIAADKVASVCAYSLSRLGRNARELLDFVELCQTHNVTVRTKVESIDTSSAMGRAMLTVMAAFAQLEAESGMERSAAARAVRYSKAEEAGALLPGGKLTNSIPAYGFRHTKGADSVIRREPDPDRPIEPVLQAYRDSKAAGRGIRGAAILLQERNVPSPSGGNRWAATSLRRILRDRIPDELPDRNASGKSRDGSKHPVLFAGIVRCHCGRTMSTNYSRKDKTGRPLPNQLYCSGAAGSGREGHGRYVIAESALKAALWPEASRQYRPMTLKFAERNSAAIDALTARKERVSAALLDGLISPSKAKGEHEAIDAKLEKLNRQSGAWLGFAGTKPIDLNGDPAEQNAMLRRLWLRVQLDSEYSPTVEWIVDPDQLQAEDDRLAAMPASPDDEGWEQR
jgi:DNA invertase Pin-like site-specific DNA recombinase